MLTSDFDYCLPPQLIAQSPSPSREASRLLVVHRSSPNLRPLPFSHLPQLLHPGDLLVLNNSRVFPARLRGRKAAGGGSVEILLLEPAPPPPPSAALAPSAQPPPVSWLVLLRPGKRVRPGSQLLFGPPTQPLPAIVREKFDDGRCLLDFPHDPPLLDFAERHGEVPLPPYIDRTTPLPDDRDRYQTVYAEAPGSVAAPTAGLHFSTSLLDELAARGILTAKLTLHVGLGTFTPVKAERLDQHVMHEERYVLPPETVDAIHATRSRGNRVIAVGTTSLRVLESVARQNSGRLIPGPGRTRLFLHPPSDFHVVDALITNFHLPKSTLLMLVSAFAAPGDTSGRDLILRAYAEAIRLQFRFFSYGDAMLLI